MGFLKLKSIKKTWLLVIGIMVMEGLSWATFNTEVWLLAIIAAFIGFAFCGMLLVITLKTPRGALKWIICIICVGVIVGHLYSWLWLRSGNYIMLSNATVMDIRITDNNSFHVKMSVVKSNNKKEYDVIFKQEDTVSLEPGTDKSYDVLVCYHGLYPHITKENSIKEHIPNQ